MLRLRFQLRCGLGLNQNPPFVNRHLQPYGNGILGLISDRLDLNLNLSFLNY
jgi:hypothetical protein